MYSATIGNRRYAFADLATLLAKASPLRSGDCLAGIAAESGEERVAAQYALADLPLRTFLHERGDSLRERRGHPAHRRQPRPGGVRADRASDGRRLARLAALRCADRRGAREPRARHHARDGGGGQQDQPRAGPDGDGGQVRGRHPLPQHHRPARPPVGAAAAQSSDRRRPRHRGQHPRRPAAGLGRRGDRHQPGDRQPGARPCAALDARRDQAQARDPDAKLRAGARDHDARPDPSGRAGRPGVPVDRRQRGGEQELRHQPRAAARGARGGAGARARHASATT